jgi:hypothetical protein
LTHHYESKEERALEMAIQCRDFTEAYDILVRYSRSEFENSQEYLVHEKELINHCKLIPSISPSSWNIGDSEECKPLELASSIKELSYLLPPGFSKFTQIINLVPTALKRKYELVILRNEIVETINSGNWKYLIEHMEEILKGIEFDISFLDQDTALLILQTLLHNSFMAGLQFGQSMGQIVADATTGKFDVMVDFMHHLLFPTAYERSQLPTIEHARTLKSDKRQDLLKNHGQNLCRPISNSEKKSWVALNSNDDQEFKANNVQMVLGDSKLVLPMVAMEM